MDYPELLVVLCVKKERRTKAGDLQNLGRELNTVE